MIGGEVKISHNKNRHGRAPFKKIRIEGVDLGQTISRGRRNFTASIKEKPHACAAFQKDGM
jgi:hypothetical protein